MPPATAASTAATGSKAASKDAAATAMALIAFVTATILGRILSANSAANPAVINLMLLATSLTHFTNVLAALATRSLVVNQAENLSTLSCTVLARDTSVGATETTSLRVSAVKESPMLSTALK